MPFADVLYACDEKWWDKYHESISFKGELWTLDLQAREKYKLNWVYGISEHGLGHDKVHFGGSSGYQAINLAYLWGVSRIVLLGFDCKPVGGKDHWFGQHPQGLTQIQPYDLWIDNFSRLAVELEAQEVEVINCSSDTALTCFKRLPIESVNN